MKPVLAVHAGAWRMPGRLEMRHVRAMHDALKTGWAAMPGGALEAVTAAVSCMEKSGDVNAGAGGVLNRDRKRELDAMVMDSAFNAGSVASLSATTEAVRIARCVMQKTPHVLLVGKGADAFARKCRAAGTKSSDFSKALTAARREFGYGDTVGAIALDQEGKLAAATSTGGTPDKIPGRVGDSPLVGSGGYAAPWAACSTTGHGEALLKICAAKTACDFVRNKKSAKSAATATIRELERAVNGLGGLILLNQKGDFAVAFNTPAMSVGWTDGATLWARVLRLPKKVE